MDIGNAFKDIREIKDLSQTEFGNVLGISRGAVYGIENNLHRPSPKVLAELERKFDISPTMLLFLSLEENEIEKLELFRRERKKLRGRIRGK